MQYCGTKGACAAYSLRTVQSAHCHSISSSGVLSCSFVVYGGDALISHCIWSAGYGMTQPMQSYFKPHVQMFDMGRWERRPFMNMLIDATEGTCNEICQAQVILAVARHAFHSAPLLPPFKLNIQFVSQLSHLRCWFAVDFQSVTCPLQHSGVTVYKICSVL